MNERLRQIWNHPLIFTAIVDLEGMLSNAVREQVVSNLIVGHTGGGIGIEDWFLVADVVEFFYESSDVLLYVFFDDFKGLKVEVKWLLFASQISKDVFIILGSERKQVLGVYFFFQQFTLFNR